MKTCYIVGAGEFYGSFKKQDGDLIIAADGGFDTLKKLGIKPDAVIGDMDSIGGDTEQIELLRFPVRKDETDSFLAYREGVMRGYKYFELYGCAGGRDDHTFANFSLLIQAKEHGHTVKMVGKECDIYAMKNEALKLFGAPEKHLSLFAFGEAAKGVTVKGLEYEAEGITLSTLFPLAVSNRFTENEAFVEVTDGRLLIMIER